MGESFFWVRFRGYFAMILFMTLGGCYAFPFAEKAEDVPPEGIQDPQEQISGACGDFPLRADSDLWESSGGEDAITFDENCRFQSVRCAYEGRYDDLGNGEFFLTLQRGGDPRYCAMSGGYMCRYFLFENDRYLAIVCQNSGPSGVFQKSR